jgi:hypothetical protein
MPTDERHYLSDGQGVWSWRPKAGVKSRERSKGVREMTVTNKVKGSPRRARSSRKTIAQGRPV